MEVIFNLGTGNWQTPGCDDFVTTPSIELWGQVIRPMAVRSVGKNTMLGVRFYPHAAAFFLRENIGSLSNKVVDFSDLSGKGAHTLHSKLADAKAWDKRIALLEEFLCSQLTIPGNKSRIALVNDIMQEIKQRDFFDNIENVALRYGMTSRYLQKLFLQYTGLTPKLYIKINRFQNSLRLVARKDVSLTSIAYDCGYFDQSHFIRDFKSFTGITPSGYSSVNSPVTPAFVGN